MEDVNIYDLYPKKINDSMICNWMMRYSTWSVVIMFMFVDVIGIKNEHGGAPHGLQKQKGLNGYDFIWKGGGIMIWAIRVDVVGAVGNRHSSMDNSISLGTLG